MNAETLRLELRNFHARSETIERAVGEGEAAVEAALALLNDRHEGVRWSAIRILAEIGDTRAVAPLIALIEKDCSAVDAANALRALTGKDFGEQASAWRQWLAASSGVAADSSAGELTDAGLVAEAVRDLPVAVESQDETITADVTLDGGRTQRVWLEFCRCDPWDERVVRLSTACGAAGPERHEWALKLNMSIPYGAIGLADLGDTRCFVLVNVHRRETVTPADLAKSLMALAIHGDMIEKALSDEDRY